MCSRKDGDPEIYIIDGAWDLWRMAADGSGAVRLTEDPANDTVAPGYQEGPPRWSPDGEWLVWPSQRDGADSGSGTTDPPTSPGRWRGPARNR